MDEIEFARKLKRLFEDVGVKKVHYFCRFLQEKLNFEGHFYIEFNDGTLIEIADGEYGDLSCVMLVKKKELEDKRKEVKDYCKNSSYTFEEL